MIATVEIGYSANSLVKKLDRESYGRLRTEAEVLQLEEWDEGKNDQPYWSVYGSRVLAMVPQDTMVLDKWGIEYRIVKFRNTYRVEDPDTHQHVHVHIPNVGLLAVREVMVLEDACTNSLQDHLDDGWSILAICPPNATRRPDYILGRADKR